MEGNVSHMDPSFEEGNEWPGATAWFYGDNEAMHFTDYLIKAGFSDQEALDIALAAAHISSPEEAQDFVESAGRANGYRDTFQR